MMAMFLLVNISVPHCHLYFKGNPQKGPHGVTDHRTSGHHKCGWLPLNTEHLHKSGATQPLDLSFLTHHKNYSTAVRTSPCPVLGAHG